MSGAALEATNLSVRPEKGADPVISGVSFTLSAGEMLGVLGANGAGKTTLIKACAALLKPESGEVRIDGIPAHALPPPARAKKAAYLEQRANLAWPLPVWQAVALGRIPHGASPALLSPEDTQAVEEAMERTQTTALRNRRASALSGGELSRVLLARALAVRAPLLLADEPVAGLDPRHQWQAMECLRSWCRSGGAVMIALHDLSLAARFCDRVLLLHEGKLFHHGPAAEVLAGEAVERAYGMRFVRGKIEEIPIIAPKEALPE